MGMIRHAFRTLTRPYYVAVAQTIGDYLSQLVPKCARSRGDPRGAGSLLERFDIAAYTFLRNSNFATLTVAVQHWAHRVATPSTLAGTIQLFDDSAWLKRATLHLQRMDPTYPNAGSGLTAFRQALAGSGLIATESSASEVRDAEPNRALDAGQSDQESDFAQALVRALSVPQRPSSASGIAEALFECAMTSVKVAENELVQAARLCNKDSDSMQWEALYLMLFTAKLSLDEHGLTSFDAVVDTYVTHALGRNRLVDRTDRYLIALEPGASIPLTLGREYARICGCDNRATALLGAALASTMLDVAEQLTGKRN